MRNFLLHHLCDVDPQIHEAISQEQRRQEDHLELIASENYTSCAVMEAQGSCLTNKYAEGYPGVRYYGGCEYVDDIERLAIARLMQLFGAEYANVQPHSGSQANQAVFYSILKPGDRMLGMSLAHGGHLSHGAAVNISGRLFDVLFYGVDPQTELIDYAQVEQLAQQHRPRLIIAGASSYPRVIDWQQFRRIADGVGAYFLADMAHYAGLVAAGVYPSPVGVADFVTATTHKTLRGPRGGLILSQAEHARVLNATVFPGMQGGPLMHVIAGKAVAFQQALTAQFRLYQAQVLDNARAMANVFNQTQVRLVAGGTDCHMLLLDTRSVSLTGQQAEQVLKKIHITVNRNTIPNDPEKPFVTSGVRIGTPALTTRGMKEPEAVLIAQWMVEAFHHAQEEHYLQCLKEKVLQLCRRFPVYESASS